MIKASTPFDELVEVIQGLPPVPHLLALVHDSVLVPRYVLHEPLVEAGVRTPPLVAVFVNMGGFAVVRVPRLTVVQPISRRVVVIPGSCIWR